MHCNRTLVCYHKKALHDLKKRHAIREQRDMSAGHLHGAGLPAVAGCPAGLCGIEADAYEHGNPHHQACRTGRSVGHTTLKSTIGTVPRQNYCGYSVSARYAATNRRLRANPMRRATCCTPLGMSGSGTCSKAKLFAAQFTDGKRVAAPKAFLGTPKALAACN